MFYSSFSIDSVFFTPAACYGSKMHFCYISKIDHTDSSDKVCSGLLAPIYLSFNYRYASVCINFHKQMFSLHVQKTCKHFECEISSEFKGEPAWKRFCERRAGENFMEMRLVQITNIE